MNLSSRVDSGTVVGRTLVHMEKLTDWLAYAYLLLVGRCAMALGLEGYAQVDPNASDGHKPL